MKLLSGLAIVACHGAYAQSGDGSAETAIDTPESESMESPALRQQRAFSSENNSDYEYYYEQSALGRRKKKKKKKIIFNIPQRPTTTRAPPTTTRAPLPAISNDYNQLFGENGSFGSKVSSDYLDYNGGAAGVANSGSNRWSGFGGSDYSYDYADGFGEITVGNTYGGKGQFEFHTISNSGDASAAAANSQYFNGSDDNYGEWNLGTTRWDNDDINKYWEHMHRQWGHQQENRLSRHHAYDPSGTSLDEPSRWFHVPPENVINNLNRGYLNYQFPSSNGKGDPLSYGNGTTHFKFPVGRRAYLQAGRHGHPWGIVPDKQWELKVDSYKGNTATGTASNGDGGEGAGGSNHKFGWYAQPWLWDAENVAGVSDYKLWNGVNYGKTPMIGHSAITNFDIDDDSQEAITHTFGFIDWKDADKNSFPNDGETGIIPGTTSTSDIADGIRFQDVSPARAPWYGRRFDASWELGDSPAHFVLDGIGVHRGHVPFDTDFTDEKIKPTYLDRTGVTATSDNLNTQAGWQRYYSGYRWFPGIANFVGEGGTAPVSSRFTPNMWTGVTPGAPESTNQMHDPAKLKCHQCIESAHLEWDDTFHTFKLVSAHSIKDVHYIARDDLSAAHFSDRPEHASINQTGPTASDPDNSKTHSTGVDLWKQCFDTLKQRSCEYSSGVCFVEERRVWGYVTQVQAGCQQSQACYMQKYQNFVVEAGRQCWPGDAFGEEHKLATRPDDMRADQWIYNIIKGGLMLAEKPMFSTGSVVAGTNDHQFRKFASHYFTEFENDKVNEISSLARAPDSTANGAVDIREKNNWVDKFHTGFTGSLEVDSNDPSQHQLARATLTDGNYGVGRSGYESAFSTLLHYPTFMDVGKLNNYIYRGGSATTDGTADTNAAYVTADVAHSNQVYGMKISDSQIDEYDKANKGQKYLGAAVDIIPAVGQTDAQIGADGDLDWNGQGGADGSMFAERSQFYQNEASRFASDVPIDDQWRNPDQHNYIINSGASPGGTQGDTGIFRQTLAFMDPKITDRWTLNTSLDNIIEADTRWQEATRYQPIQYKNGLVEASKCHQCCNTDHNCNWNWQPTTKVDWNFAYVWRYQAIDEGSNTPDQPAGSGHLGNANRMGVGSNDRFPDSGDTTNPDIKIATLSQVTLDHHFNFPPYLANHEENRGGTTGNLGYPSGAATPISDQDSGYVENASGSSFTHYEVTNLGKK